MCIMVQCADFLYCSSFDIDIYFGCVATGLILRESYIFEFLFLFSLLFFFSNAR